MRGDPFRITKYTVQKSKDIFKTIQKKSSICLGNQVMKDILPHLENYEGEITFIGGHCSITSGEFKIRGQQWWILEYCSEWITSLHIDTTIGLKYYMNILTFPKLKHLYVREISWDDDTCVQNVLKKCHMTLQTFGLGESVDIIPDTLIFPKLWKIYSDTGRGMRYYSPNRFPMLMHVSARHAQPAIITETGHVLEAGTHQRVLTVILSNRYKHKAIVTLILALRKSKPFLKDVHSIIIRNACEISGTEWLNCLQYNDYNPVNREDNTYVINEPFDVIVSTRMYEITNGHLIEKTKTIQEKKNRIKEYKRTLPEDEKDRERLIDELDEIKKKLLTFKKLKREI